MCFPVYKIFPKHVGFMTLTTANTSFHLANTVVLISLGAIFVRRFLHKFCCWADAFFSPCFPQPRGWWVCNMLIFVDNLLNFFLLFPHPCTPVWGFPLIHLLLSGTFHRTTPLDPVSYTHLDVYKRQGVWSGSSSEILSLISSLK